MLATPLFVCILGVGRISLKVGHIWTEVGHKPVKVGRIRTRLGHKPK